MAAAMPDISPMNPKYRLLKGTRDIMLEEIERRHITVTDEEELARLVYANDYFAEWRCDDGEVGYGQFEYLMGASDRFGFPPY